jgi:histidinol-phosphatase (PHP family)
VIVDYHMHLRRPTQQPGLEEIDHTADAAERYVEVARERGVDEIGFTEHVYYFRQTRSLWTQPYYAERCVYDLDVYVEAVLEAKRRGHPVKLGLEVDYVPGRERETYDLLEPYPWDFLLGSVHDIEGHPVDSDPAEGLWKHFPVEEVWRRYFIALRGAARSGLFDALAHPDLVKIFGMRPSPDSVQLHHEETADALEATGRVALEVSSGGLRKPVGELYPDPAFLEACRARDVPVTLASDAHLPDDVGRDFDQALELMRRAGYDTVTVFEGRTARQEPLG